PEIPHRGLVAMNVRYEADFHRYRFSIALTTSSGSQLPGIAAHLVFRFLKIVLAADAGPKVVISPQITIRSNFMFESMDPRYLTADWSP
ncbi:MAG: hypothetical protein QW505_05120, partial [Thermoplasmata archaeon]